MDKLIEALKGCPLAELFGNVVAKTGVFPSLGSSPEELVRMWLGDIPVDNPVDTIRERMIAELQKNWDVWAYRLSCDGDCYKHPDAQVIWCYIDSGTVDLYEE